MVTTADTFSDPGAAEVHHDHRDVTGGWLRPAVFGVMDGLVSNVSLIAGVSGGGASPHTIALTGLAGLIAGAVSMATGEYTSVSSQTELTRAEIAVEKREIAQRPDAERTELTELYISRGVEPELARRVVEQLSQDPEQTWRIHAREELGVDPDDLPSPWTAASSSFAAFAVGAILPLLPYLLGASALWASAILSAVGLFVAGALVSRFTSRGWLYSGLRQLALGALAAAVTYGIGRAVGVGLG
ncbi:MAG TPA: VIT1/CCC1 transporter family protein [Mycobacteriales bacterium]|nr:VIT1/CCC1 transporter family protein [Mycobacteriales bacterium]